MGFFSFSRADLLDLSYEVVFNSAEVESVASVIKPPVFSVLVDQGTTSSSRAHEADEFRGN